jgi:hypothetical protein
MTPAEGRRLPSGFNVFRLNSPRIARWLHLEESLLALDPNEETVVPPLVGAWQGRD